MKRLFIISFLMILTSCCFCDNKPSDDFPPIKYELTDTLTFYSVDSTNKFTITEGCALYLMEQDNYLLYHLINCDMIDDKVDYHKVLINMGRINDTTEIRGYIDYKDLKGHKRLR